MEINVNELERRASSVGLAEWGFYVLLLAKNSPNVNLTEYSVLLGVTVKTLRRYLLTLQSAGLIRLDSKVVIFVQSAIFNGTYISFNVNVIKNVIKDEPVKRVGDGVMAYWCSAYMSRYGAKYVASNWAREQASVKILALKYGDRLLAIMDVVLRLYETRWYSQKYPRPTIGALVSWLAAQADGYVLALPSVHPVNHVESAETSLSAFDDKFGLGGDDVDKI